MVFKTWLGRSVRALERIGKPRVPPVLYVVGCVLTLAVLIVGAMLARDVMARRYVLDVTVKAAAVHLAPAPVP